VAAADLGGWFGELRQRQRQETGPVTVAAVGVSETVAVTSGSFTTEK
jgi:hypothetical protein